MRRRGMRYGGRALVGAAVGLLALWALTALPVSRACERAYAAPVLQTSRPPTQFCYRLRISITNGGASGVDRPVVPFSINADGLREAGYLGTYAWDLLPTDDTLATEVEVFAQDLDQTGARWWLQTEETLAAGSTVDYWLFQGHATHLRDQALPFAGAGEVVVSDAMALDLTDDITIIATLAASGPQDADIVNKHDDAGSAGYGLRLVDGGGSIQVQGVVDGQTAAYAWDGTEQTVRMRFLAPDLTLSTWDEATTAWVQQATVNTGLAGASVNGEDLALGTGLTGLLRHVEVHSGSTLVGSWGFAAAGASESTYDGVDTYTGTIEDEAGTLDGAYTLVRDTSDLTVSVGTVQPQFQDPIFTVQPSMEDVIQELGFDPFAAAEAQEGPARVPFLATFADALDGAGVPPQAGWLLIFTTLGVIVAVPAYVGTSSVLAGMLAVFVVFLVGAVLGVLQPITAILMLIAMLGMWAAERVGRE